MVEEPLDILALNRTGTYKGVYHVLHGSFSPMEGVLEDDLKIRELVERVRGGTVRGGDPGHQRHRGGRGHGQPDRPPPAPPGRARHPPGPGPAHRLGLEYADDYTLSRALEGRREY